jgi:hypothetical protein
MMGGVKLDGQPYCGEELLPHATLPDGTPAPVLCTSEVHSRYSNHSNEEVMVSWRWQDADGNWLSRPATQMPEGP